MGLLWSNSKYWLFETMFGSLIEVEKAKHPTYVDAIAEARRKARDR